MNYGAIGYVIGHEITHGFDDQGRQFDPEGNLVDWWQNDTRTAYLEKAHCITDQNGGYKTALPAWMHVLKIALFGAVFWIAVII